MTAHRTDLQVSPGPREIKNTRDGIGQRHALAPTAQSANKTFWILGRGRDEAEMYQDGFGSAVRRGTRYARGRSTAAEGMHDKPQGEKEGMDENRMPRGVKSAVSRRPTWCVDRALCLPVS